MSEDYTRTTEIRARAKALEAEAEGLYAEAEQLARWEGEWEVQAALGVAEQRLQGITVEAFSEITFTSESDKAGYMDNVYKSYWELKGRVRELEAKLGMVPTTGNRVGSTASWSTVQVPPPEEPG